MSKITEFESILDSHCKLLCDDICKELPIDGMFFDIGSNTGHLAKKIYDCRPDCHFHLFEPVDEYYSEIINKFSDIQNISINKLVVSYEDDEICKIWKSGGNLGWNTILENALNKGDTSEDCITTTLDTYIKTNSIKHIDVIKIDVELAETYVIKGFHEYLLNTKKLPTIFCEIAGSSSDNPIFNLLSEELEFLFTLGYEQFEYDRGHTFDIIMRPI